MNHVLIVEDHERNRALLKMLLEANGYRVTVAGDGVEALAAARRAPPDAIVSDVLLPKMDGFALCRAWMQAAGLRAIPFIFYSGIYVHPDDEQFAMALGAVRYLIKPVEAEVFLRELHAVLQQSAGRARSLRRRAPGVLRRRKPLSLLAWRAGNRSLSTCAGSFLRRALRTYLMRPSRMAHKLLISRNRDHSIAPNEYFCTLFLIDCITTPATR